MQTRRNSLFNDLALTLEDYYEKTKDMKHPLTWGGRTHRQKFEQSTLGPHSNQVSIKVSQ